MPLELKRLRSQLAERSQNYLSRKREVLLQERGGLLLGGSSPEALRTFAPSVGSTNGPQLGAFLAGVLAANANEQNRIDAELADVNKEEARIASQINNIDNNITSQTNTLARNETQRELQSQRFAEQEKRDKILRQNQVNGQEKARANKLHDDQAKRDHDIALQTLRNNQKKAGDNTDFTDTNKTAPATDNFEADKAALRAEVGSMAESLSPEQRDRFLNTFDNVLGKAVDSAQLQALRLKAQERMQQTGVEPIQPAPVRGDAVQSLPLLGSAINPGGAVGVEPIMPPTDLNDSYAVMNQQIQELNKRLANGN